MEKIANFQVATSYNFLKKKQQRIWDRKFLCNGQISIDLFPHLEAKLPGDYGVTKQSFVTRIKKEATKDLESRVSLQWPNLEAKFPDVIRVTKQSFVASMSGGEMGTWNRVTRNLSRRERYLAGQSSGARMLKKLFFFFLTIVVFVLIADYLLQDEYDLIGEIKHTIFGGVEPVQPGKVTKVLEAEPPQNIENPPMGIWANQRDSAKVMELVWKTRSRGFKLSRPADLAVLPDGSSLITDRSYGRHVELAPDGNFRRYFYLRQASESPFDYPALVEYGSDKIYTVDDDGTIFIHSYNGRELNRIETGYEIYDIAADKLGNIYVVTPADSFRLHKFDPDGRHVLAFAPQTEKEQGAWSILSRGHVDTDSNGNVYFALETPYVTYKYSPAGEPLLSFTRKTHLTYTPPTIHRRNGKVVAINRQQYSYDFKIAPDNTCLNLIKLQRINGGDTIDMFSPEGQYLQSIYLARNYERLGVINRNDFLLQLPRPINTVERYQLRGLE